MNNDTYNPNKQFMCYWGSDFVEPGTVRLELLDAFTTDKGYEPREIRSILNLSIGETYHYGMYPSHFITRVEDLPEKEGE